MNELLMRIPFVRRLPPAWIARAHWAGRGVFLLGFSLIVWWSLSRGWALRQKTWEYTQPIRFLSDIERNYRYGQRALLEGYLNVYEIREAQEQATGDYELNYAPLRLLLFRIWAGWTAQNIPAVYTPGSLGLNKTGAYQSPWDPRLVFNAPVMDFNTTMELLAAIGAFLLTRLWVVRSRRAAEESAVESPLYIDRFRPFEGWIRGLAAALLLWFNPAILISAHGWATWDMWVIPFFIWGVLLASMDWWFAAGVVVALGAAFKGQQLVVAPIFILWPLFCGRIGAVGRFIAGFTLLAAIVVSPWMLTYRINEGGAFLRKFDWPAAFWIGSVIFAAAVINVRRWWPNLRWYLFLPVTVPVALLLLWPAYKLDTADATTHKLLLLGLAAGYIALAWLLKLRHQGYVLAGGVGAALLLCMLLFHGSRAWWDLGYQYGTTKHYNMIVGPANNLPALLSLRYGYHDPDTPAMTFKAGEVAFALAGRQIVNWPAAAKTYTIRQVLRGIYVVLLVASAGAIALQSARRDRNFLIAITVPWLLMYGIMAQMHERYLLFAAGIGVVVAGTSFGPVLAVIFLGLLTAGQTLQDMPLRTVPAPGQFTQEQFNLIRRVFGNTTPSGADNGLHPNISWAVLTITAVFFVMAFTRSWRGQRRRRLATLPTPHPIIAPSPRAPIVIETPRFEVSPSP